MGEGRSDSAASRIVQGGPYLSANPLNYNGSQVKVEKIDNIKTTILIKEKWFVFLNFKSFVAFFFTLKGFFQGFIDLYNMLTRNQTINISELKNF